MYHLKSKFKITLEQDRVVEEILDKYRKNQDKQVLLGVTGSGKTFVMANLIERMNLPALVLSPNKTLAAQLYQEFKGFFPENRVGYFISYYDYYQPEAYVPQRNIYISKEVSINSELERLRINAARNLLESKNAIIVASVSAIYSIGSPDDFMNQKISYFLHSKYDREGIIRDFVSLGYVRTEEFIESGKFRVRGDILEIFSSSEENPIRFFLEDDHICGLEVFDPVNGEEIEEIEKVDVFPINYFFYKKNRVKKVIEKIKTELKERVSYFLANQQEEFAERLKERTLFDIEMLSQYGYCPGIENYSYYLTGRKKEEPPYTISDFFRGNYLTIIDESHIAVPQLSGMYLGDRSRKQTLVQFGFRLPSALENRPLNFEEVNQKFNKVLFVSATPSKYEFSASNNNVTSLLVRPTGLLDPQIELRSPDSPVEDLLGEIVKEIGKKNRVLVTTLTKKMSEKLADFLLSKGIKCTYMHSEIKSLDRIKIIKKLRYGDIDVLIGINLLREGLDLPEVSLVAILDADIEGFLRSETSLIQTFGRAARNVEGRVILYMKRMTDSIKKAVEESVRRRKLQLHYNKKYNIAPKSITKTIKDFYDDDYWIKKSEEIITEKDFKNKETLEKEIHKLTLQMKKKAENLDFKAAMVLRDRVKQLKNLMLEMY